MTTDTITTTHAAAGRDGRPLVFSWTETLVFVFVAAALIATAAVPAMIRHPHMAEAKTVASVTAPVGR
jgi:hydroxyethylthiazole kinase-like sugar kinase family protein